MVILDPRGGFNTAADLVITYDTAALTDGTLGNAGAGVVPGNPFVVGGGTAVDGFPYRVVSSICTLTPTAAVTAL